MCNNIKGFTVLFDTKVHIHLITTPSKIHIKKIYWLYFYDTSISVTSTEIASRCYDSAYK